MGSAGSQCMETVVMSALLFNPGCLPIMSDRGHDLVWVPETLPG